MVEKYNMLFSRFIYIYGTLDATITLKIIVFYVLEAKYDFFILLVDVIILLCR